MLYGRLEPVTGRLSNIWDREPGPNDVLLMAMPLVDPPWSYDAANKLAVAATQTEPERLDGLAMPRRVQAALILRASSAWGGLSAQRKARIQAIIDDAAAQVIALLT